MNSKQLRIFELVLVLGIAFLPAIIRSLIFIITGQISDYSGPHQSDYIIWIAQSILSIVLLFYVLHNNELSFIDIGLKLKFDWRDLLVGFLLMIGAGTAGAVLTGVIRIFSPDFIENALSPQNIQFIKTGNFWLLLFIMIVVPLEEELIVRGFTMSEVFKLSKSKSLAIVISVAIQFTYHLYQGIAPAIIMLPYFILISVYFVRTGNLNPVIYSHILIDLLNLVFKV